MRKLSLMLAAILLAVGLAACGEEPTVTPVPTPTSAPTATPQPPTPTPTAAPTTARNPIVATITAASGTATAGGTVVSSGAAGTPASPTPAVASGATNLPVYSGLKPVDLGLVGTQITTTLSQASSTARSVSYYTSDSFDKIAGFYNAEMPKSGYAKVAEQALPANAGLSGNVLLYAKGAGVDAEVAAIMNIGPLDATLAGTLSAVSPTAAGIKAGDSLVIVLSGLTGKNLVDLQSTLGGRSPAATPTK